VTCLKKIISPPKSCLLFEIIFENCYKIADIEIFLETARSLVYLMALCKDQGRSSNHLEAAVAKLFVGDRSLEPFNGAVPIFRGYGYCDEYDVERIFRDNRLGPIGGGTSDIQKDYFPAYVRI
jgi:butyryl-CoA dehydrogenase